MNEMVPLLLLAVIFAVGLADNGGCKMTDKPSDIVFLVDESGSVSAENFKKQMKFVEEFVSNFTIGPQKIQIGLVTFSSDMKTEFNLNTCSDITCTLTEIRKVQYDHPALTATDAALDYVRTDSFTPKHGDRPGVSNILIVTTDGISNVPMDTKVAAKKVKAAGITVFAVGIGGAVDKNELTNIASLPRYVSSVGGFNNLSGIHDLLQHETCQAVKNGGPVKTTPQITSQSKYRTTLPHRSSSSLPTTLMKQRTVKILPTTKVQGTKRVQFSKTVQATIGMRSTKRVRVTTGAHFTHGASSTNKAQVPNRGPSTTRVQNTNVLHSSVAKMHATSKLTTVRRSSTTNGLMNNGVSIRNRTIQSVNRGTIGMRITSSTGNTASVPTLAYGSIPQAPTNTTNTASTTLTGRFNYPGFRGVNTSRNGKDSGVFELKLPEWMFYLEVACLTAISIITAGATICCCKGICSALVRWKNEKDDEEGKKWRKKFRKPTKKPNMNLIL